MGLAAKVVQEVGKKFEHTPGFGYVTILASALLATALGKTAPDEEWSLLLWANTAALSAYWVGGFLDDVLFDPVFGVLPEPPDFKKTHWARRFIVNPIRSVAHRVPLVKSVEDRRCAAAKHFHSSKKTGIYKTGKKFFEATEVWNGRVKLYLDLSKVARTLVLPSVLLLVWEGLASRNIVSLPAFLEAGKPLGWLRMPVAPIIIAIVSLALYVWLRLLHMNHLYGLFNKSKIFKFSVPATLGRRKVIWAVGERLIPERELPIFTEMTSEFYIEFNTWADRLLTNHASNAVVAYNFKLYEDANAFAIQLAGTRSFDVRDQNWRDDESFSSEDFFHLPHTIVGNRWENGLEAAKSLVKNYLSHGTHAEFLKASRGVGVGFVNDDIEFAYLRRTPNTR